MIQPDPIEVSVLVVTYNHEKYIVEAINSVLQQKTTFPFEILVSDDCSTDHTQEIIRNNYSGKVKMILRKRNVGATKNGYCLMRKARGRYLIVLEGDDYWVDTMKLQQMYEYMEDHTECSAVSQMLDMRDDYGKRYGLIGNNQDSDIDSSKVILGEEQYAMSGCLFRNFFKLFPKRDFSIIYKADKHVGDLTIVVILMNMGILHHIGKVGGVYRVKQERKRASNYNSLFSDFEKNFTDIRISILLEKYFGRSYSFDKRIANRAIRQIKKSFESHSFEQVFQIVNLVGIKRIVKKATCGISK